MCRGHSVIADSDSNSSVGRWHDDGYVGRFRRRSMLSNTHPDRISLDDTPLQMAKDGELWPDSVMLCTFGARQTKICFRLVGSNLHSVDIEISLRSEPRMTIKIAMLFCLIVDDVNADSTQISGQDTNLNLISRTSINCGRRDSRRPSTGP